MDALLSLLASLKPAIPMAAIIVTTALALTALNVMFQKQLSTRPSRRVPAQLAMLILTALGLLAAVVAAPLSDARTGQLLSLIGILGSAAIALASTTFLGNAMAGLMLRAVGGYRLGDFVRVGEHFGRVSEQGLFHTEIQTEHRDLTTLPNLYLVTNPVQVIRPSGTVIKASVSLGYDVHHSRVESLLLQGAADAGLEEPFVHVTELGDHAVTYRVAGLLPSLKELLSAPSRLRKGMLDALHAGGVEILSPTYMNQRPVPAEVKVAPAPETAVQSPASDRDTAEALAFDKAEQAGSIEELRQRDLALAEEMQALEQRLKEAPKEQQPELEAQRDRLGGARQRLAAVIQKRTEELRDD